MIPALLAQVGEFAERRFAAEQQHDIAVPRYRASGGHPGEGDPGLLAQRVGVIEVGQARKYRRGDAQLDWAR